MNDAELMQQFASYAFVLGVSTLRLAIAFVVLPLFTNELIPALVRNSIFVALALVVVILIPPIDINSLSMAEWVLIFAKEAFIGLAIGVFFGIFLWAFEAAGVIIDTQIGASMAMVFDPLSGHEVTLFGEFLARWSNYLFMAAGGLMLLTAIMMESYILWPIQEMMPNLSQAAISLFESEFARFFRFTLMIAAPVVVVVLIIDLTMGLVNRFAQRLNVFFLSNSLKSLAAILIVMVSLPLMVSTLVNQIAINNSDVLDYLSNLFG